MSVSGVYVVPQRDDIIRLRTTREEFTYLSWALSYDSKLDVWYVLDTHGEEFVVKWVLSEEDWFTGRERNVWNHVLLEEVE